MSKSKDHPIIPFNGIVDSVKTRKGDKSIVFSIATNEISDSLTKGRLMDMQDQFVRGVITLNDVLDSGDVVENIPREAPIKTKGAVKSPSKRLREILFVYHQKKGGAEEEFNAWYEKTMEEFIEHYKTKINLLDS